MLEVLAVLAVLVAVMVATATMSYARALSYPGSASWSVRTVDWVREHGGSGVVNTVENWWYSNNAPTGSAPASSALPRPVAPGSVAVGARPPPLHPLAGSTPLPGEAQWVPSPQRLAGVPAMYTGFFRSDPNYPSLVVGVAWMDQTLIDTHLIAGTREPGGVGWPDGAQVPPGLRPALLATFNSGWKIRDSNGGYYAYGRTAAPLRDGAASLVIDTAGRVMIGQWGRDVGMNPRVAAVRQNLDLVIDHAQPAPGLADNTNGAWGNRHNQAQYTWRSGLGTDNAGNLVYVAGNKLTLVELARAMTMAGIVTGMQLDIHPQMVAFNTCRPAPAHAFGLACAKLLPDMIGPATRYLTPDQRDFLAVTIVAPTDHNAKKPSVTAAARGHTGSTPAAPTRRSAR
ncbi:MAG: hypothetical protein ACREQ5_02380 [Candidatus Dormibacteria bacterium]